MSQSPLNVSEKMCLPSYTQLNSHFQSGGWNFSFLFFQLLFIFIRSQRRKKEGGKKKFLITDEISMMLGLEEAKILFIKMTVQRVEEREKKKWETKLCKLIKFVPNEITHAGTKWGVKCVFIEALNWRTNGELEHAQHIECVRERGKVRIGERRQTFKSKCLCKKVTDLSQFLIASQRSHSTSTPLTLAAFE